VRERWREGERERGREDEGSVGVGKEGQGEGERGVGARGGRARGGARHLARNKKENWRRAHHRVLRSEKNEDKTSRNKQITWRHVIVCMHEQAPRGGRCSC